MPEKEGMEIIRDLRREAPNMAILAVSGAVSGAFYLHVATQLGANAVLSKPFTPDDLVGAVTELLSEPQQAA
jgi:DNA-binding NarL/FixJ family response regulator